MNNFLLYFLSSFATTCLASDIQSTEISSSSFMWGSMFRISHLHAAWSCASLPDNPFSVMSCLWFPLQSSFPSPAHPSRSLFLPTYSSSVLISCAYYFNLFSCTFLDISPIFIIRLILSCLIPFHMSFSTSSCRPHQCATGKIAELRHELD